MGNLYNMGFTASSRAWDTCGVHLGPSPLHKLSGLFRRQGWPKLDGEIAGRWSLLGFVLFPLFR